MYSPVGSNRTIVAGHGQTATFPGNPPATAENLLDDVRALCEPPDQELPPGTAPVYQAVAQPQDAPSVVDDVSDAGHTAAILASTTLTETRCRWMTRYSGCASAHCYGARKAVMRRALGTGGDFVQPKRNQKDN